MRALYDTAFQETLRKPADPATLVGFAEIAIKVGDLEGAISALDRLLLIDGDQPEVKLELGVLYFRLGSFEAARNYLEEARTSTRASAAIKERAGEFIKELKRP
jgi:Flp pilus assembly protein TadD